MQWHGGGTAGSCPRARGDSSESVRMVGHVALFAPRNRGFKGVPPEFWEVSNSFPRERRDSKEAGRAKPSYSPFASRMRGFISDF